jgi:hypothetical protein
VAVQAHLGIPRRRGAPGEFDWLPGTNWSETERVSGFLEQAHSKRGVFRAVVKAIRPHVCRDRDKNPSPPTESVVKAVPQQIAAMAVILNAAIGLSDQVPWVTDPRVSQVTTGVALLITMYGVDEFCRRTLPAPRPEVVET